MRVLLKLHPQAVTKEFLDKKVLPEFEGLGIDYEILTMDTRSDRHYPVADFVLVLGGDGTFLAGAVAAAELNIPIIGLEFGHLGFLCNLPVERLTDVLTAIKSGDYSIEERYVLDVRSIRSGTTERYVALNDAVVGKSQLTRLVSITCWVNEEILGTFKADGVVVATATGSTAYSLSAGGPIVEPGLKLLLVTPICAHSLYAKPMVIGSDREVRLTIAEEYPEVHISLDGYILGQMKVGDELRVRLRDLPLKVARIGGPTFLEVLRAKFGWGYEYDREKNT